jgi:hypothetical protein
VRAGVQLRAADIRSQLRAVMRHRSVPKPVALYGAGSRGKVEVDHVIWDVVPVRSELELRAELADTQDDHAIVFLLDYDDRLPLDLACRLAGQRVHTIDRRLRLANLFGARKLAPGFAAGPLVDVLLDEMPELPPITGTLLQPDDAWKRYLHLHLKLPAERPTVAVLLGAALERPEDGRAFGARRKDQTWVALLGEAGAWFERSAGAAARVVWDSWTQGAPQDLVAWLVHLDAARRSQDRSAQTLLRQALRYARDADEAWLAEPVAEPLCTALESVLSRLEPARLRVLLHRASQIFADPDFAVARRASPWLIEGFDALQDDLAGAMSAALKDSAALSGAFVAFEALARHRQAAADEGAERQQQVREAGVRLLNWLCWLERFPLPEDEGWLAVGALSHWYDTEGGWVDWARDELRNHSTGHERLDTVLREVLARADELRRGLDRRFAQAVLSWHSADKPSHEVLPIERVLRDVVARFLEPSNRRLVIVLLDGMSVSVATRLVESRDNWAPVDWTPGKHRRMPPAIAVLPTLTATSRASFFSGRHETSVSPGSSEAQDPDRFARHAALSDLAGSAAGPRLFLRGNLGSANALSAPLLAALRDGNERVVAVVINAVDDQLKGSEQVSIDYERPGSIPLLERMFQVAQETERSVLLVSDHGHVPVQQLKGSPLPDSAPDHGHRWRALRPGQAIQEGEVELPEGCWKPKGAKSVAVFWDERRCWGEARVGAHGGLTLAEAVIPIRLLAPNWLYDTLQPPDDGLRTHDQEHPRWWRLQLPPTASPAPRAPVVPQPVQPTLFPDRQPTPKPLPAPAPLIERHPVAAALAASERFQARSQEQRPEEVERALGYIDVLLKAGGAMPRDAFARAVGIKAHRLSGRIAQVGFLNADGYPLLEHDLQGDQVRLHLAHLKAQYGISA